MDPLKNIVEEKQKEEDTQLQGEGIVQKDRTKEKEDTENKEKLSLEIEKTKVERNHTSADINNKKKEGNKKYWDKSEKKGKEKSKEGKKKRTKEVEEEEEAKEQVEEEEERDLEAGEEKAENNNHEGITGEEKKNKQKTKVDFNQLNQIFDSDSEEAITQGLVYLKDFITKNKPTLQDITDWFQEYFCIDNPEGGLTQTNIIEKAILNMFKLLKCFAETKTNSITYKAFFAMVQQVPLPSKETQSEYYAKIPLAWKYVHLDSLNTFLNLFDAKKTIKMETIRDEISILIKEKKFQEAVKIILVFDHYAADISSDLIDALTNNKEASKAADIIKQLDLDSKRYPNVEIRLKKQSLRYHLRNFSWEFVAELYSDRYDMLAYAVEDLMFQNKYDEAFSILQMNPKLIREKITKIETIEILNNPKQRFNILPNTLRTKDRFSPSSENTGAEAVGTHLNLTEMGITRDKVLFVDSVSSEEFQVAKRELESAQQVGFDCEFKPQVTKLDSTKQTLCLVQIATQNYAFVMDAVALSAQPEYLNLLKKLFENPKCIKIGHTIRGDVGLIAGQIGCQLHSASLLDLQKVHKAKYKDQALSSLSFIAKLMLGKGLCKAEQTSNWNTRPLREAQLHYAALDAYVSIAIFNKYLAVLGEKALGDFVQ